MALRVAQQLAVLRAAELLELDDGQVRLAPVPRAVDLVRLPVAAVAGVLLYQPHLSAQRL